jgi:hypothetical protein
MLFFRMTVDQQCYTLWNYTYWYKRLDRANREKIKNLLSKGKVGCLRLKEILHYSDATVVSFLTGFPGYFADSLVYNKTDRIHNAVIANMLNQPLKTQKGLKRLRKMIRWCGFNKVPFPLELFTGSGEFRCFSYHVPFIKEINKMISSNSRNKMFKVLMISQTRAAGLATDDLSKLSLEAFRENVRTKRPFVPSPLLTQAIEDVTDEIVNSREYGPLPNLKVSISTSACTQVPKKFGGKYAFAKQFANDIEYPEKNLDLFFDEDAFLIEDEGPESIIVTKLPYQTLGEIMWSTAYDILSEDSKNLRVNVACVREAGKCRVVTSGSFWKDALLQPFSHLTIEMCKVIACISSAFRASKHGWDWITNIEDWEPLKTQEFKGFQVFCSDWMEATDHPSPDMGRAVTGRLLEKMGVPSHILNVILSTWLGEKDAYINGKFAFTIRNGIMMGDPLTKTNLCLAHPICIRYATYRIKQEDPAFPLAIYGKGNGDDLSYVYNHPLFPKYFSEAASMLGYEESPLDTFVSSDWLFYCEEAAYIPQHSRNYVSISQKHNNIDLLPYLDYPRMRLVVDVKKDREDFSSSTIGKFTLLGKEIGFLPSESVQYNYYQFAGCCQDVLLDIHASEVLPILPHQFFGIGKEVTGATVESLEWFLFKSVDWKRKFLKTIIKELLYGDWNLLNLRSSVSLGQKHFEGQPDVETFVLPSNDPIKHHRLIPKELLENFPAGVVERLVSGGELVYESQIWKYYLMNQRFRGLINDEEGAVNLFEVVKKKLSLVDEPDLSPGEMEIFLERWRKHHYQFRRNIPEDVYDLRTVRELLCRDPIRINNMDFLSETLARFKREPVDTVFRRETRRLYNWFREVIDLDDDMLPIERFEKILEGDAGAALGAPTSLLEDDPIIIQDVCNTPSWIIAVVSNDLKMHRLCVNKAYDKIIIRIPVASWVITPGSDSDKIQYIWNSFGCSTWLDTGNIQGYINATEGRTEYLLGASFNWRDNLPTSLEKTRSFKRRAKSLYDVVDLISEFGSEDDMYKQRQWESES